MPVYLHGLSLENYRGIGPQRQKLGPFRSFNFFIGPNNAGKSTVLNFISKYLPLQAERQARQAPVPVEPLERHAGGTTGPIVMAIGIPQAKFAEASANLIKNDEPRRILRPVIERIVEQLQEDEIVWLQTTVPQAGELSFARGADPKLLRAAIDPYDWGRVWRSVTGQGEGSVDQHWIPETLKAFRLAQPLDLPQVQLIPAIRQIGPAVQQIGPKIEAFSDFSGRGLIDKLAEIQSPDHDRRHERELFDRINLFLQIVSGSPDARIEIPHNRVHILVHMNDKVLPLSSLGTGIHEVIMIAAFCTLSHRQIVCIEEPELHLHPVLQRKLIAYLREYTENQYFIATHSASFIDTPGTAIFHVRNEDNQTKIRESTLRKERFSICVDLGHRASDIVQSNSIIWVEGPSDRVYIRHWIRALAPDLQEGIHYSIMFYGGRLLSHLSADDDEVSEFIDLRSLNRNISIIIDSDKRSARQALNGTKSRVIDEFRSHGGICWVTKGREIENYIDHNVLQECVRTVYSSVYREPGRGGIFDHPLHFSRNAPKPTRRSTAVRTQLLETDVDKVKVARLVCESEADLRVLDLQSRVSELVSMVRQANT